MGIKKVMRAVNKKCFKWGEEWSSSAENYLYNTDAFLNVAVGSIRSGKTITALTRFLLFMLESKNNIFAMAGKTSNTLKRNVVDPFLEMLNAFNISYEFNKKEQEIYFLNNTVVLFGIEKEGADAKIQGFTCGGTLIDEATVIPESGFQMLISRNSQPGAQIFITCNPTNPANYIYVNYVSNKKVQQQGKCTVYNFFLEDNPNIPREYIENIKNMYPKDSIFYKRYILNQWVSGQGMIYQSFNDENILTGNVELNNYRWLHIGSDYGVSSTTAYTIIGKHKNGEYHQLSEYGHDAQREGIAQTDKERADNIIEIQDSYNFNLNNTFYCSHDAASLKTELETRPDFKMDLKTFKPDTIECINIISSLFHKNKFKIHESCTETIKQVKGYEWDIKAAQKGIDKPVKKDDHYPDAFRAPIITDILQQTDLPQVGVIYL